MTRLFLAALALLAALPTALPAAAEEIGSVGYRFKWLGPNDKIVVEAFDDPDLAGITCYLARARTGGLKGMVGLAEDPPYASISCHQVGPVDGDKAEKLKSPHHLRIHRSYLVDLRQVSAVEEGYVRIGKENIPVGKTHKEALMARIRTL